MPNSKIKTQKEIVSIVKKLKKQRKKIVTYNGSFDLLHAGHLTSLREAKSQGDVLVILVNSDKSVKSYKGPNRPIVPEKERAETLAALEVVDYVVLFDDINPKAILAKIKPHVHCNGSDWGKDCIERGVVEENGGRIHILKWVPGLSTSGLIKKILTVYAEPDVKAVFLDRDGVINFNEPEYLYRIQDFKFIPGALSALKKLSKTSCKLIIVTNQSGIGRGYYTEKDLKKLHQWLLKKLRSQGIRIDKIYYCPHAPGYGCSCRKPKSGMVEKAVKEFGLTLDKSWIIGDDEREVIMGREVNLKAIKLGKRMTKDLKLEPNFYAKDLAEAVSIIYAKEK